MVRGRDPQTRVRGVPWSPRTPPVRGHRTGEREGRRRGLERKGERRSSGDRSPSPTPRTAGGERRVSPSHTVTRNVRPCQGGSPAPFVPRSVPWRHPDPGPHPARPWRPREAGMTEQGGPPAPVRRRLSGGDRNPVLALVTDLVMEGKLSASEMLEGGLGPAEPGAAAHSFRWLLPRPQQFSPVGAFSNI